MINIISKLLVMDRETGNIEHRVFHDVIDYLNEGDVLVLNETKNTSRSLTANS